MRSSHPGFPALSAISCSILAVSPCRKSRADRNRVVNVAMKGSGIGMQEEHEIFPSRFSGAECDFMFDLGGVSVQEVQGIEILVNDRIVQLASERIVDRG